MTQNGWETVSSERHFANPHVEVVTDQVRTPSRSQPQTWTIVHRKAAVVIAPMTGDGRIVLIRQERIPIRAAIWEMPSGQIDNVAAGDAAVAGGVGSGRPAVAVADLSAVASAKAETIEQVALRELREETGYQLAKDGKLIALGDYFSSPGFTDERGYFFLARPVEPNANYVRDETESILDCRAFSAGEIRRMIAGNEIRDANTLGVCARLAAHGFLSLDSR